MKSTVSGLLSLLFFHVPRAVVTCSLLYFTFVGILVVAVVVILLRKIIAIQLNLSANPGAQICLICVRNGWTNRYVLHNPRGRAALILLLVGCADSAAPATNAGGAGASGGSSNTGTTTTPTG